jgi:transposase-like protein
MTTHLTSSQLAKRWGMSSQTLSNWRNEGKGPRYRKMGGLKSRVIYPLEYVEAWEKEHEYASTSHEAEATGKK